MRIVPVIRLVLAAMLAGGLAATSAAQKKSSAEEQSLKLLQRPPSEIEPLIKVTGDSLDPKIEVNSKGATQVVSKGWISSTVSENSFLRAYIDKKTGAVDAQIYHIAIYGGRGWNFFRNATYESADGIKEVEAIRAGSDVSCQRYGCTYYEDIVVPVDYKTLQDAARAFDPANPIVGIKYRLFGQSGAKIDEVLPGNEIVAFVNRHSPSGLPLDFKIA